ncbi:MAG: hypothetical protein WCK96_15525 [Methylococcales bacterium]
MAGGGNGPKGVGANREKIDGGTSALICTPTQSTTGTKPPDYTNFHAKRITHNLKSESEEFYSISFKGFDSAEMGIDCRTFRFTVAPTVKAINIEYEDWGFNDIYVFYFFRITAKIEWEICGVTPNGETKDIKFSTEFSIRMTIKRLMILEVQREGLGGLKLLLLMNTIDKVTDWLAKLPMVILMIRTIENTMTDYCNGKLDIQEKLREIFKHQIQEMEWKPRIVDGRFEA